MAPRDTTKADTDKTEAGEPVSTTAPKPPGETLDTAPADQAQSVSTSDPQRVVIEQAPPEPAVYYGEGGIVPGNSRATDPNKPHTKAKYEPFKW